MLSVGTRSKPVEGHATRRPAGLYSDRGGEHGKADSAGDLSNAPGEQDMPQSRCCCRLRPYKDSAGLPSAMFPPTSIAEAPTPLIVRLKKRNGFKPR
jgi:hypothetical protein